MNVWAIDKDVNLKHVLLELVHRYGENTFGLEASETHFQAVEIFLRTQPSLRAYIFTFSQARDRYGIDLFFPMSQSEIVGENEELTFEHLLTIIETHFNVT